MNPVSNSQFDLNVVYFVITFILAICMVNSFHIGMHWVKYSLLIASIRNYLPYFDIEGYYFIMGKNAYN